MRDAFSAKLLNKHKVVYRQCTECGLLQAEEPYWLDEAYSEAIAVADTGLVMRNFAIASKLAVLLFSRFESKGSYLDVAGGYGMLARLMRDYGFDYYWDDKYCQNLLARGFEADKSDRAFVALTAFEVLEHVHDPLAFIKEVMGQHDCRTLIFSTELYEGIEPPGKDWWYYTFNTGQHISFYRRKTLEMLAAKLSLNFNSIHGLHILSDRTIGIEPWLRVATGRLAPLVALFIRRKLGSLTLVDHFKLMGKLDDDGAEG
jgi:hypothetical protein